ncbi:Csu type fimbrial protein [Rickettsiella grylli]|uniref:Spore Coat Protein U domain family n=1 Tax=Rickettsiella grylli TaxID=59196 RepID=A8PP79_9COXI|nr:spore coat protein U domain-containing protein [Rickettsiella grylli]EDP46515.1 spore Coat Protein U domain family [Rickettsiella grylli]
MGFLIRFFMGFLFFLVFEETMGFTMSNTLAVTATVGDENGGKGNCSLNSIATMKFPNYYPLNPHPDDAIATMTVTCLSNLEYNIQINKGEGVGATEAHRFLTKLGGTQQLEYNLFQEANHQHKYGMGQNALHRVATGLPEVLAIYGQIPSNQKVEAGPYLDQVTIFVTF